jgi:hypothetical protein
MRVHRRHQEGTPLLADPMSVRSVGAVEMALIFGHQRLQAATDHRCHERMGHCWPIPWRAPLRRRRGRSFRALPRSGVVAPIKTTAKGKTPEPLDWILPSSGCYESPPISRCDLQVQSSRAPTIPAPRHLETEQTVCHPAPWERGSYHYDWSGLQEWRLQGGRSCESNGPTD